MSVHECRSGFTDLSSASSSSSSSSSKPCKDRWMGVDRALISLAVTRAWAQQRAADAVLNDRAGGESGNTNVGHGCRSGAVVEGVRTGLAVHIDVAFDGARRTAHPLAYLGRTTASDRQTWNLGSSAPLLCTSPRTAHRLLETRPRPKPRAAR